MTTLSREQPLEASAVKSPATHAPSLSHERDNNFDFLRFSMAVLVIWYHCFPLGNGPLHQNEPLANLTHGLETTGSLAVDTFFIISGYLIAQSWERSRTTWSYLKKRIARIFPGFAVATLFMAFVVAPIFTYAPYHWMGWRNARHLVIAICTLKEYVVPGVFAKNPFPGAMNSSMWTIRYEFLCYLTIMGMGLLTLLRRRWAVTGLFVVLCLMRATMYPIHAPAWSTNFVVNLGPWVRLFACFFSGTMFYLYREKVPYRWWLAAIAAAGFGASFVYVQWLPLTLATCFPYLVFWCAFQKYVRLPRFARFGDFSYGIYVYAFPIQQIIISQMKHRPHPMRVFLWAAPISIGAGALSWHLVEKHFLARRRGPVNPAP